MNTKAVKAAGPACGRDRGGRGQARLRPKGLEGRGKRGEEEEGRKEGDGGREEEEGSGGGKEGGWGGGGEKRRGAVPKEGGRGEGGV